MKTSLKYVATTNHQGTVITFAQDAASGSTDLYYDVLNLTLTSARDEQDWTGFTKLVFPDQLRPAGMGIVTTENAGGTLLGFADEPFKVVSDGQYVCVFRQSSKNTLLLTRFMFKRPEGADNSVPVLEPAWEVRFERSGKEDVPANSRDTQNYLAPDGSPFIEPTVELSMIKNLAGGAFDVALLPNESNGSHNWQFFALDSVTQRVNLFNFPADEKGLFNLEGKPLDESGLVAPDRSFRLLLSPTAPLIFVPAPFSSTFYTVQERVTSEDGESTLLKRSGRTLLAITVSPPEGVRVATVDFAVSKTGTLAEIAEETVLTRISPANYALEFDGRASVALPNNQNSLSVNSSFRIDCLIYPKSAVPNDQYVLCGDMRNPASPTLAPYLKLTRDLKVAAGFGDGQSVVSCETTNAVIASSVWSKVTVIYDAAAPSNNFAILINDQRAEVSNGNVQAVPFGSPVNTIGFKKGGSSREGFVGVIDGLRIQRIDGAQPVTLGDWPFDAVDYNQTEPTTPDTSSFRNDGTVSGAKLVPSSSPSSAGTEGALQIDPHGLTIYSGLLDFVQPSSAPYLLNGSDGLLHLYFRDQQGLFSVAQNDAEAARAVFESGWSAAASAGSQTGNLRFLSVRSGTFMNQSSIKVAPSARPELCDVELDNHNGQRELWRGVPRDLDTFIDVLAGRTASDPNDPRFNRGQVGFYDNNGLYPVCRMKTDSDVSDVSLVFLSRFPAVLPLHSVAVTDVTEQSCTVVAQYDAVRWQPFGASQIITQTWRDVPVNAREALNVLNGLSGSYDYAPTDTSTAAVYKLHAAALVNQGVEHNVLILTREGVTNFSVGVTGSASQDLCHVRISLEVEGAPKEQEWNDVPRQQVEFAAALQAEGGEVSDLILVLTDGLGARVADHDPADTRAADMLAWAGVFDVYNDGLLRGGEKLAAQAPVPAAILQKSVLDEESHETVLLDGSTLFRAVAYTTPSNGGLALVEDTAAFTGGDANLISPAINSGWLRESPRKALQFAGNNAVSFDISQPSINELAIAGDMSVAAWCQTRMAGSPGIGTNFRLLNFNRRGTPELPDERVQYCLGLTLSPCLRLSRLTNITGTYDLARTDAECTLQILVKPTSLSGPLMSLNTTGTPRNFLGISVNSQRRVVLTYGDNPTTVLSREALRSQWTQLTGTVRNVPGQNRVEIRLYVDGVEQGSAVLDRRSFDRSPSTVLVGTATLFTTREAEINGVLMWDHALTTEEVQRTFERVAERNDSGLVLAWYLTEGTGDTVVNRAVAGTGLTSSISGLSGWSLNGAYTVPYVGNRDYVLKAPAALMFGGWRHLASVYRTGYALLFSGDAHADCGRDSSQNADTSLSLEAWMQPQGVNRVQSIISKQGAYEIALAPDNTVVFRYWTSVGVQEVRSLTKLQAGTPYYIAATVETGAAEPPPDPANPTYFISAKVFLNGVRDQAGYGSYGEPVSLSTSSAPLTFGRSSLGGAPYNGYLSDVRLWAQVLTEAEVRDIFLSHSAPPQQDGLISSWDFSEMMGKVAYDANDLNNAVLSDNDLWSIFSPTASLTLLIDGKAREDVTVLRAADVGGYGAEQFTIGALRQSSGAFDDGFRAQLDEVRVWQTTKTPEEVADDIERTLTGRERALAGYWKFDNGSGTVITDETGHGNDGTLAPPVVRPPVNIRPPVWVTSQAPLGNEAREVYNVLGGVRTPFQQHVSGAPAAVEYADTQRDAYGNLFSVMKRCYVSEDAGAVRLVTGYKVDDLDTVYAGQVQSKPTLVGFIEGAPPVPSENQTVPHWTWQIDSNAYAGITSIQLQAADNAVKVYSGSENTGQATSNSSQLGIYMSTGVSTGISAIELISFDVFTLNAQLLNVDEQQANTQAGRQLGFSYGQTTTVSDVLAPGGAWENENAILNPEVGRRYLPLNHGYAVVKSFTADLYMVKLKGTGTVVKFNLVLNPDTPEDVNIVEFPIDPHYTKNGTLDGMVGFVNDPDYPDAGLARGSYFKPLEAYRLKRQAEKQNKQLEAYYRQFKISKPSSNQSPGVSLTDMPRRVTNASREDGQLALGPFKEQMDENPSYDWPRRLARRNLVNTYVWTAGGGLHSEQESLMDVHTESFNGLSDSSTSFGQNNTIAVAPIVGFYGEFDHLATTSLEVSSMKSSESEHSYGLNVEATPEWFLRRPLFDEEGEVTGYTQADSPGKVNGYRFMSFFLAPAEENFRAFFDKVVDNNWLQLSASPNAAALRETTAATNGAWRILHRVTYVSRVPQQLMPVPAESFAPTLTPPPNLANNTVITRLVEEQVGPGVRQPTPAEIGRAIDAVLGTSTTESGELGSVLPWWADFLGAAADVRSEAFRTLLALRNDLLAYMIQKYAAAAYEDGLA